VSGELQTSQDDKYLFFIKATDFLTSRATIISYPHNCFNKNNLKIKQLRIQH